MRAIVYGARGASPYHVAQELPEDALFDVPENRWARRSDEWHTGRLNVETRLLCDEAATSLREGYALNQWRIQAVSESPKLTAHLLSNGMPASSEDWAKLDWAACERMADWRKRAREVLQGRKLRPVPTWMSEGAEWEFAEHPDTREDEEQFEENLERARLGQPKAVAWLQDLLDGKRNVAVAMTVREKKDYRGQVEQKGGIARAEVDHRLMLVRLTDPNLAHPERMAQLVRAGQIIAAEQRPDYLAQVMKDAPRYAQILQGAPDLLSVLKRQEPPAWPRETEDDKVERIRFLRGSTFTVINESLDCKQIRRDWI